MPILAAELRLAIRLMPLLESRRDTMPDSIARASSRRGPRLGANPGAGAIWAHLYELPLRQHLARAAVAFDMDRELIAAARGELPMSALIEVLERDDDEFEEPHAASVRDPITAAWAAFGYVHSLFCALRALLVFGESLNAMVASARERGDDKALLNAIRIDPAIVCGRTGALRLARACLDDDRRFLAALRAALAGKLSLREQARVRRMRRVLRALSQSGAARLGDRDLGALHARLSRLYPSAMRRGNAARDLRACATRAVDQAAARSAGKPGRNR